MENDPKARTTTAQHAAFRGKEPTRYRIVVGKRLSPGGEDPSQTPVTLLEGIIQDQAQLSGLLNTLYDMGFPLVKVVALEE